MFLTCSTRKHKEVLVEWLELEIMSIRVNKGLNSTRTRVNSTRKYKKNPVRSFWGRNPVDQGWKRGLIRPELRPIRPGNTKESWSKSLRSKFCRPRQQKKLNSVKKQESWPKGEKIPSQPTKKGKRGRKSWPKFDQELRSKTSCSKPCRPGQYEG